VIDTAPERPTVRDEELRLPDGKRLALDTREWDAWLAQALSFDVAHPAGDFLVAHEKRRRGGLYWVARRYDRGRRASAYIGARVTASDLEKAATELAAKISAQAPAERKAPPGRRVLSTPQLDAIAGESDPTTIQAVVAELLEREADPGRRAALQALQKLVASVWPDTERPE
jgi:hypothetical protein